MRLILLCVYYVFMTVFSTAYRFPFTQTIRDNYEQEFRDKCGKYPFVQQFTKKLEYPGKRHLMFVYQEPGLRNGGLGDRLGGMLSAVTMALRFNRTLVIRNQNGFDELFRPYHPIDIKAKQPKYLWSNYRNWSQYDVSLANNDNTEYDLWDCINNVGSRNSHCSMDGGDASQPIILLRSNRCYLCYYDRHPNLFAYKQMAEVLGVNTSSNLIEVAGCMMRLSMWPTNQLWDLVDTEYDKFSKAINLTSSIGNYQVSHKKSSKHAFHQVGTHFRCGDNNYGLRGPGDAACLYSEQRVKEDPNFLASGDPFHMGLCVKEIIANHTAKLAERHHVVIPRHRMLADTASVASVPQFLMTFIASDNEKAAKQIGGACGYKYEMFTSKGCHIERDSSKACHDFTVSQWFILSLSNSLVTQFEQGPPSSFSRYAGVYGLKDDPFHKAQDCSVKSNMHLSRIQQSNWFC